jgi:hypothetical protein
LGIVRDFVPFGIGRDFVPPGAGLDFVPFGAIRLPLVPRGTGRFVALFFAEALRLAGALRLALFFAGALRLTLFAAGARFLAAFLTGLELFFFVAIPIS